MFFLEFPNYFWNTYLKEQSNFHAEGIINETDELRKT